MHRERVREGEGRRETVSKIYPSNFFVIRGCRVVITPRWKKREEEREREKRYLERHREKELFELNL